jgi:catechol 2,3-dioxygenase-like lactoylglutathione lyase family enzyme
MKRDAMAARVPHLLPSHGRQERIDPDFRTDATISMHVPDLAAARAFYRDVLGFRLIKDDVDQLVFDTGALRLYINWHPDPISFVPAVRVRSAGAAKRHLVARGARVLREWGGEKGFYLEDPFGHLIDVVEETDPGD